MRDKQLANFLPRWNGFSVGTIISVEQPLLQTSLSDILQENVPERYFLSPKACAGILNRAERRGKKLPEMLDRALRQTAGLQK